MKKLEVLVPFTDVMANVYREARDVFEVDDERAEGLLNHPKHIVRLVASFDEAEIVSESKFDLNPPLKTSEGLEATGEQLQEELEKVTKPVKKKITKKTTKRKTKKK